MIIIEKNKEKTSLNVVIAIDFDGTCVTNEYPKLGKTVPDCVEILKKLLEKKNKLVLMTQRDGKPLTEAINWFAENTIELYGINDNPQQHSWNKSRKIYADIYIDDRNLGCPLTTHRSLSDKPFVDWKKVEKLLKDKGVL